MRICTRSCIVVNHSLSYACHAQLMRIHGYDSSELWSFLVLVVYFARLSICSAFGIFKMLFWDSFREIGQLGLLVCAHVNKLLCPQCQIPGLTMKPCVALDDAKSLKQGSRICIEMFSNIWQKQLFFFKIHAITSCHRIRKCTAYERLSWHFRMPLDKGPLSEKEQP